MLAGVQGGEVEGEVVMWERNPLVDLLGAWSQVLSVGRDQFQQTFV